MFDNKIERLPSNENNLQNVFNEIMAKAKERLQIAQENEKKLPSEGMDDELDLEWQFWTIWSLYYEGNFEKLKSIFPELHHKAIENYKRFTNENRWEAAEEWEMTEENQFFQFIEGVKKELKEMLKKENKEN